MKKMILAAALLLAVFSAHAGSNNGPDYGDVTTNNNQTYNNPSATGGNAAGYGGAATATGGTGVGHGGDASVGDIRNTNTANGGSVLGSGNSHNTNTALGGVGFGGSANQGQAQGQHQGQGQSQSNGQAQGQSSETNTSTSTATSTAQSQSANNAGNSQQVGGQSTNVSFRQERNAPPVFLGNVTATVSCAGGVNAGASSQGGSGAFGFTWISADCKQTVVGQNMLAAGKVEMACEIWKQTDGFKRAAKRNPALAELNCK